MIEANIPFWLVWNPTGFAPKHKHSTRQAAENEAERLAREHPGLKFYVLMPTCEAVRNDIQITRFSDDLPF